MSQPFGSTTLFLGDLSIFCNEQEIFNLFQPFGPIESVQLKKCEKKKPHLSYGFIKFAYRQSADQALQQTNGQIFLGRAIRVGWAMDNPALKSPKMRMMENKAIKQTAQIHVTFTSRNPQLPVTEATLRHVFSRYGEVVDVTINKTMFNKVKPLPSLLFSPLTMFSPFFLILLGFWVPVRLWICSLCFR
jgi:RNA recognition motif-containing protein